MNLRRVKLLAQPVDNSKQSLLHRADTRTEIVCDLLAGQPFLVFQYEHQLLTRGHFIKTLEYLLNHNIVECCTV